MVQKDPKRPRGRPRAYDPEHALMRATDAFWQAGFSGTSLDDLSTATSMNRPSLYGAFGDKRAMYLATIDRYVTKGFDGMVQALDFKLPLAEGLRRVYYGALSIYLPEKEAPRGCFLIGTAATEAVRDREIQSRLCDGLRQFDSAFEARFRHAIASGEIGDVDPVAQSRLASAVLHTLAIRSRAGDSRAALKATADAAIEMLSGTKPAGSGTARKRATRKR
jgi:AcrR family transcriptional regulator